MCAADITLRGTHFTAYELHHTVDMETEPSEIQSCINVERIHTSVNGLMYVYIQSCMYMYISRIQTSVNAWAYTIHNRHNGACCMHVVELTD